MIYRTLKTNELDHVGIAEGKRHPMRLSALPLPVNDCSLDRIDFYRVVDVGQAQKYTDKMAPYILGQI